MARNNDYEKIVSELRQLGYTIATMESCTGGSVASAITNVSGSSEVLKFSAVTYGTDFKIKFGVNPRTIEKHTVFSTQVSKEMAKCISRYADSNIGIGVTGNLSLNTTDGIRGGEVCISIYNRETKEFITKVVNVKSPNREKSKEAIVEFIAKDLIKLLAIDNYQK